MDREDLVSLIDERLKNSLTEYKAEIVSSMESIITKISGSSNSEQLSKISGLLNHCHTFKRKSNEEQYKYYTKISLALEEANKSLQSDKLIECRDNIAEAQKLVAHRQKIIRLADSSELGWRVVNEYESNPLASDSDDEKRIFKAEARASKKLKAEKSKKTRIGKTWPYSKRQPSVASTPAPVNTQQSVRRPGLCFDCGKPGHWKGAVECQANASQNKISINSMLVDNGLLQEKIDDVGTNEVPVSPAGRLKSKLYMWKLATDSKYIHSVIESGYRIPFIRVPESVSLKNNRSARDNMAFVRTEIDNLLKKEVISEVKDRPYVVNPLTVAYNKIGKPRLVLDCRHINDYLHQFKVKFENIVVAESLFSENTFMYTFDLKGAYHHIDIFNDHRTYLRFSCTDNGLTKYYVYNQLPFGIKTAGHIFTKVLKVVITFLRTKGHRVIAFLDDGIGGEIDNDKAMVSSLFTKETILEFGFLLAEEKCQWVPSKRVIWLGHVIDMHQNLLFITDERVQRLLSKIQSIFSRMENCELNLIQVRVLAYVVGQIISMQSVLGSNVRLMIRELFKCINSRASWNAPVKITPEGMQELVFWDKNVRYLNNKGKPIKDKTLCRFCIYSDASDTGYGGYVVDTLHEGLSLTQGSKALEKLEHGISSETEFTNRTITPEVVSVEELSNDMDFQSDGAAEEAIDSILTPEVVIHNERLVPEEIMPIVFCGTKISASKVEPTASEIASVRRSEDKIENDLVFRRYGCAVESQFVFQNEPLARKDKIENSYSEMIGSWSLQEQGQSSTWREAESIYRIIQSNVDKLKLSSVKVFCDNKNVKSVLANGSRIGNLHQIALRLKTLCENENIALYHEWIPRARNDFADHLSRCFDCDDWEIEPSLFRQINYRWGPFTIDRFASHLNAKCKRFNSRWWVPDTEGIDCMTQPWHGEANWVVPPPRLIPQCLQKIIRENAYCTIVIPKWKSAAFWPMIVKENGQYQSFVADVLNLGKRNVIVSGRGNNGCFSQNPLAFDMLAVKCNI